MHHRTRPDRTTGRKRSSVVVVLLLGLVVGSLSVAGAAVGPAGTITTVAGNGGNGYSGDGGPATSAQVGFPTGVAAIPGGGFYISQGCVIRKVDTSGIITAIAGDVTSGDFNCGYTGDGGPATQAFIGSTPGLAVDAPGNLFIVDADNNVIRRIDVTTHIITTVAGNGTAGYTGDGGLATTATLNNPQAVAVDRAGDLFIADSGNHVIRRVDATTRIITTVAGNGTNGNTGDGGPATSATLSVLSDVVVDAAGNLFIADTNFSVIRRVDAATQVITRVAGGGTNSADGIPATSAVLGRASGIALDSVGNLFIAETVTEKVRKVDATTQIITTVAGGGFPDDNLGDNGPATSARLLSPKGIDITGSGDLLIAEEVHHRIRSVAGVGGPTSTTTSTSPSSTTSTSTTSSSTSTSTSTSTTIPSGNDGPPTINYLSPQVGRTLGGTPIRIQGSGFRGTTSVTFGSAPATKFKVVDGSLITAVAPSAAAAGASNNTSVTVTVTDNQGSDTGSNLDGDTRASTTPTQRSPSCPTPA